MKSFVSNLPISKITVLAILIEKPALLLHHSCSRLQIILISIVALTSATHYQYHGPSASIGHDGRVMDTPEVAHARAAHLAAVAEAAAKVPHSVASYAEDEDYHGYSEPVSVGHEMYHNEYGYHGPFAPLDSEGRVIDTPEVAQAKAAHLAAYNHIASSAPVVINKYHSQIYKPPAYSHNYYDSSAPLSHDGKVINTPEVEHARQAHLAAYNDALHGRHSYYDY
ncbi:pupal cuticle protein-like [Linepithema humile]|uniref:pupal cuticle protein-like n=1 Tax=Linepithema humile TaxID=83485 RepID=UPI00351E5F90